MKYDTMFTQLVANSDGPQDAENENGCWLWSSSVTRKCYGRVNVRDGAGKHIQKVAHRVMETEMRLNAARNAADDAVPLWGPLQEQVPIEDLHPDNETLDHLCWNTACINPDHWRVATRAENTAEANSRRSATWQT